MLLQILQNISLLAIATLALHPLLSSERLSRTEYVQKALLGAVLGLAALFVSIQPIIVPDGAVVDGRAGPVILAGFVGGPIAGFFAALLGSAARLYHGGPFVFSGVFIYFVYAGFGAAYAWYVQRHTDKPSMTWSTVGVLTVTSWIAVANMYWLISPPERANMWMREDVPFIFVANTASILITAYILKFILNAVSTRSQVDTMAERLAVATRAARIGIWDYDVPANKVTWSDEQYDLHGVDPDEFKADFDGWSSLLHPEDRDRTMQSARDAIEDDTPFDLEFRIVTPAGDVRQVKGSAVVLRDTAGRALRMVGVNLDISRMRHFERRAAEGEQRLADLANTMPGAIFRYSMDPDGSDRIHYMSPGCEDIWEITAEDLMNDPQPLWDMVARGHVDDMIASVNQSAKDLTPWFHEWPIETPSGAQKWLQGHGWPRRLPSGGTEWSSLILDITEQVETKNSLAESQAMFFEAQKLDAVGKLTGGVAHDFNNIIAVIMGNLELMERNARTDDREMIDDALGACRRAATLTQQLLAFSRRAVLKPEVLNLNEVLSKTERLLRRTLPETIEIETVQSGGLWLTELDGSLLESALLNLALNARDAMPNGGNLTLEAANIRLGEEYLRSRGELVRTGRYVMIAVSDTGIGMHPNVLNQVFEPFFTTKGIGEGSGMGLAMVHGFVKQSEGIIRVYSEPEIGTSVRMYFPVFEGTATKDEGPTEAASAYQGYEHVLIAEDDDQVRAMLGRQLESLGYIVTARANGMDALDVISNDPTINILVTDIVMPGMLQGPGLAKRSRELRPELPVVFMSGYPQEAAIHGNGLRPEDIQLTKPVSLRNLARSLRAALSNGSQA